MNDDSSDDDDINIPDGVIIYSVDEMLDIGLRQMGVKEKSLQRVKKENLIKKFRDRYGSDPIVCAQIWEDLQTTNVQEALVPLNKRKIHYFLMAMHFLKRYQVESEVAASNGCHEDTVRDWCWFFIEKIQALKQEKIYWPEDNYGNDTWIMTVDGTHVEIQEPKHPEFSLNTKYFSHKHQQAGYTYELGIALSESRLIWMNGPHPAGKNDLNMFHAGLKTRLRQLNKKAIGDGGYYAVELLDVVSTPNADDPPPVRKFKRRAQRRHETFNGKIKTFECLSKRFRHDKRRFKSCFECCCVIVQYQMENGHALFEILVNGMI